MGFFRLLCMSACALGFVSGASAQSLSNARPPANLPPASFIGPQFVDNRGCVYIRAGRGGTVNWVPRVSRDRKQFCGFQPTFGTASAETRQSGKAVRVVRVQEQSVTRVSQGRYLIGPQGVNRKLIEANTLKPPRGYKTVWDDGRLNPLRGVGTTSGKARMNLVWSETVPRYLIDPVTGEPATPRQIRLFGG